MKTVVYLVILIVTTFSCHKPEPEAAVNYGCDCQGTPRLVLTNALAIHNQGIIQLLNVDEIKRGEVSGVATYCNPEFLTGKVNDIDTVFVSGNLRAVCNYGDWNYMPKLEVLAIRRK
ncbi:hypothetical protein WBJ53_11410 [Spirosoma sp. SC4-14]|uniref:hypothetical protein n=1 Tax=Spirosoma sp. SC4-14 TaxID=3128900 RepID=UPI0030CF3324